MLRQVKSMELLERLLNGEKTACARLISIVENESPGYVELLKELHKHTKGAYVIGITGPPGAGKSTLTDKLIKKLRENGKKVGVIAIDPTSPFTKGAILGDRIRMVDLSVDKDVFIRSMGTRGHLGGLSRATQGAIKILDVYGCDYIIVETVGVGQSEVDIVKTADTVVMVMVPGLGDDIQAIKAGVMEIGDVFVVNKSDKDGAKKTFREVEIMLDFKKDWKFRPPVSMAIGETGEGIAELFDNIELHRAYLETSEEIISKKINRNKAEIKEIVHDNIEKKISLLISEDSMSKILMDTVNNEIDPYSVAEKILSKILL